LKENDFLVGISCDGPEFIHDKYRVSRSGKGTYEKVHSAIKILQKYDVDFNILCVVTNESSNYGTEIYRHFVNELNVRHVQFIPIVEHRQVDSGELIYFSGNTDSSLTEWSVTGENYGRFLIDVFKCWVNRDVGTVFVQIFDSTLTAWMDMEPSMCVMQSSCGDSLVMEQNGDLYNCDHFVYPEYKLGSIFDSPTTYARNDNRKKFTKMKSKLDAQCNRCNYKFACQGGCPKHRVGDSNSRHNVLCDGYFAYFSYIEPYMDFMCSLLKREQPASTVMDYLHLIKS
ncbi:SPASM domain-containing protein, partial [Vibrio sp. FNV 38]|nr:SPASM domain-containing protein [Vibrio sp. FNV 38]